LAHKAGSISTFVDLKNQPGKRYKITYAAPDLDQQNAGLWLAISPFPRFLQTNAQHRQAAKGNCAKTA
jgi:hypothetical protein